MVPTKILANFPHNFKYLLTISILVVVMKILDWSYVMLDVFVGRNWPPGGRFLIRTNRVGTPRAFASSRAGRERSRINY
jgi:hypothetical protein